MPLVHTDSSVHLTSFCLVFWFKIAVGSLFDRNCILFAGPSASRTVSDVQDRTADELAIESTRVRSGWPLLLGVVTGEYGLILFWAVAFDFDGFSLLRPPSPSKRQAVGSVVSPVVSTPAATVESGRSGSARGQSASGLSMVPKFIKPKRFVLKHSSQ